MSKSRFTYVHQSRQSLLPHLQNACVTNYPLFTKYLALYAESIIKHSLKSHKHPTSTSIFVISYFTGARLPYFGFHKSPELIKKVVQMSRQQNLPKAAHSGETTGITFRRCRYLLVCFSECR